MYTHIATMNSYVELNLSSALDILNRNNLAKSEENAHVDLSGFPTDNPISHVYMYASIDLN